MLKEYYENQSSIVEERFYLDDDLSKQILSTVRDPVCLNIINCLAKDPPIECSYCQQLLCSHCKNKILENDRRCPQCRERLIPNKINRNLKCILETLKVKCQFNLNGCIELLSFERLVQHEQECVYQGASCPLGCGFCGLIKDLLIHKKECELEMVNCKYQNCKFFDCQKDISNHEKKCSHKTNNSKGKIFIFYNLILLGYKKILQRFKDKIEEQKSQKNEKDLIPSERTYNEIFPFRDRTNIISKPRTFSSVENNNDNAFMKCQYEACNYTDNNKNMIEFHETHCIFKTKSCPYHSKGCNFKGSKCHIASHISTCNYKYNEIKSNLNGLGVNSRHLNSSNIDTNSSIFISQIFNVRSRNEYLRNVGSHRNINKENVFKLPSN